MVDTSDCREHPKKQENISGRKKLKQEKAGRGNSSTDSVNSGSGPDYLICRPLGWAS
jgi:hypothetical protein